MRSGSYGHGIRKLHPDTFEIYWTVDFKPAGSRIRYPHTFCRITDLKGAKRFDAKWGCGFFKREISFSLEDLLQLWIAAEKNGQKLNSYVPHDPEGAKRDLLKYLNEKGISLVFWGYLGGGFLAAPSNLAHISLT